MTKQQAPTRISRKGYRRLYKKERKLRTRMAFALADLYERLLASERRNTPLPPH